MRTHGGHLQNIKLLDSNSNMPIINICELSEEQLKIECSEYVRDWDFPVIQKTEDDSNFPSIQMNFHFTHHSPCNFEDQYHFPHYIFKLFLNGTLRGLKNSTVDEFFLVQKNDYCFYRKTPRHTQKNSTDELIFTNVAICRKSGLKDTINNDILPSTSETILPKSPLSISRAIANIITIPFLIISFSIYAFFPELRNVHGIIFMMYVISVFAAIVVEILYFFELPNTSQNLCHFLAFSWHYSHLARVFWINIICFDVWRKFRGFSSVLRHERKLRTLLIYSIYGWGCPAIITSIAILAEFHPMIFEEFLTPKIEFKYCWFENKSAEKALFVAPVTAMSFFDVSLYVLTAWNIHEQKKNIAIDSTSANSQRHGERKHWLKHHIKLFIIMGIGWVLEVTNQWCGFKVGIQNPHPIVWITELYNASQGIIIFTVFIVNNKVRKLLMKPSKYQHRNFHSSSPATSSSNNSISSSIDDAQRRNN